MREENIHLRAVEPGDVDVLLELENDPSVWRVSNTLAPYSRIQIEQYVLGAPNDIQANRQLRLMIDYAEPAQEMITAGAVDLFDIDLLHRRAGIGIIVSAQYRGKGIAAAALNILCKYAFETLNLRQLYCNISADNNASVALFEKSGFARCGVKKQWLAQRDGWTDEYMYQRINENL